MILNCSRKRTRFHINRKFQVKKHAYNPPSFHAVILVGRACPALKRKITVSRRAPPPLFVRKKSASSPFSRLQAVQVEMCSRAVFDA